MANTMSAGFNVFLLFYALRRKLGRLDLGGLRQMLPPVLVAGILAAETAGLTSARWEYAMGHQGLVMRLGAVFVPMTAASLVYLLVALWFKVVPAKELSGLVVQRLRWSTK